MGKAFISFGNTFARIVCEDPVPGPTHRPPSHPTREGSDVRRSGAPFGRTSGSVAIDCRMSSPPMV